MLKTDVLIFDIFLHHNKRTQVMLNMESKNTFFLLKIVSFFTLKLADNVGCTYTQTREKILLDEEARNVFFC